MGHVGWEVSDQQLLEICIFSILTPYKPLVNAKLNHIDHLFHIKTKGMGTFALSTPSNRVLT